MPLIADEKVWRYADYLKLPGEKRYEIICGRLEQMTLSPGFSHQWVSSELLFLFKQFMRARKCGILLHAPIDVILDDDNVVQPDLVFISAGNQGIIHERGIFGAPNLVVEIVSPSSHYKDTHEKLRLYERFKIEEYWLIDPYHKAVEVFTLQNQGNYELLSFGYVGEEGCPMVKSKILEGFEVELAALFPTDIAR